MKLQVYDREVGLPQTRARTSRGLNIGTETGKSINNLGRQLDQIGTEVAQKVKAADEIMEYSKVIADAKMKMGVFYSSRSKDTENYDTLTDDTDAYFKKVSSELLKGVNDVTQKARVTQGLQQIGSAMHSKAIGDATTQSIENTQATHLHTRALMVQEAAFGDDEQMRAVMMNYAEQTRSLAKLGIFEETDAEQDVLDFYNDAARGKVRKLMNDSPQQAVNYLLDQRTFSRMLKPEHRENLLAQAQRLLDAEDRRAEAALRAKEAKEAKALKQWQEANYISTYNGILAGDTKPRDLQNLGEAGLLSPNDYASLNKMMLNRNKEYVGDPKVQQTMMDQAYMGELQLRDVQQALVAEQINWDWAQKLTTEIEKGGVIVQSEHYKTLLAALKTKLGWSPNIAGLPSNQVQLIGNAVVRFRERALAGEPLDDIFEDMSVRYTKSAREALEKPRFKTYGEAMRFYGAGKQLDRELQLQKFHYGQTDER